MQVDKFFQWKLKLFVSKNYTKKNKERKGYAWVHSMCVFSWVDHSVYLLHLPPNKQTNK